MSNRYDNKKKIKVLFPFVGDSIGGSQISTIELIKNLQDSGIETLVVIHMDDILSKLLKKNRVSFSILLISRDKLNGSIINTIIIVITKFLSFRKFIYRNDINIIYTNDIRMHYIWSVSSYIIKNVKHIWHQHSAIYSRRNIIFSALSDRIITVSKFCKDSFTKRMSLRAQILPNIFNEKYIKKVSRKKKKKNFLVTYIGNSNEQKRLIFFFKNNRTT